MTYGIIDRTPEDRNFLSQLNFEFLIKKAPHLNFTIQRVALPEITLPTIEPNNPFVKVPIPGDHVEFSPLLISFRVEKDMDNYLELWNWIICMGFPEDHEQYATIQNVSHWSGDGIYSDLSLIINTGQHNPNIEVVFHDAYPVDLSTLSLSATDETVNYVEATIQFHYTHYEVKTYDYTNS